MEQIIVILGVLIIFIGIIILVIGSLLGGEAKGKVEYGFGGFIGPVPFGWASSKPMLYAVILLAIIVLAVFLVMR